MKKSISFLFVFLTAFSTYNTLHSQNQLHDLCSHNFTHQDSLRGNITAERGWWDLTYYHLSIEANAADKSLKGSNVVQYKVLTENDRIQIDLQPPMELTEAVQDGKKLKFTRDGNAYFIDLQKKQIPQQIEELTLYYEGVPVESKRPPWSGGLTWKKDDNGNDFIVTTCQGDGASLWWPCKDHPSDEPDSLLMSITVPEQLTCVGNGRLREVEHDKKGKKKTFNWFVSNPINHYCVNMNIGDYVHFDETYKGEKGNLDCDYYVLRDNLEKAKKHFKEVPRMLQAFEHWFGPYPFYEDGYKLVEVPYPGMEHQSSITYGNNYENGYGGRDLSDTGWGQKFDFIIIHESGHEWFANSITYTDIADMWIHESFTAYSENLFLNEHFGKEASADYVIGTRSYIKNDKPVIGPYDVNTRGSGDMYYKGANMLHTLRQIVNDDEKWRSILRGLNTEFYHQNVKSAEVEEFLSKEIGIDLSLVFDQYLRDTRIPTFEYRVKDNDLKYRWNNCVADFDMPVKVFVDGKETSLIPTTGWQKLELDKAPTKVLVDRNYYVAQLNTDGKIN